MSGATRVSLTPYDALIVGSGITRSKAVARLMLAFRARQVARSVGRRSRRGGKGSVHIDDTGQLFCIHPAVEAFADEQPSLALLVACERLVCGGKDARKRRDGRSAGAGLAPSTASGIGAPASAGLTPAPLSAGRRP